jgi:hypothetical protein
MPHYYFDIKDGHRLVDPSGRDFKNDSDAIDMAKVFAIQVSLDTPKVDPERHIGVLDAGRVEIAKFQFIPNLTQALFERRKLTWEQKR